MQEELYERVAQLLNHEVLSLQFVVERLQDRREWPAFKDWRREADAVLDAADRRLFTIREAFGRGADAHDNWGALMAYARWFQGASAAERRRGPPRDAENADARAGYDIAETMFDNDALVRRAADLIDYESALLYIVARAR